MEEFSKIISHRFINTAPIIIIKYALVKTVVQTTLKIYMVPSKLLHVMSIKRNKSSQRQRQCIG